jgi:hypothetical protein
MDEEIERLVVSVRADTQGFSRDVAAMRAELDGPFAGGLERAGRVLESSLLGALQRGKFGFDDLRRVALSVISEIASAAIRSGLQSLGGGAPSGSGSGGGGIGGLLAQLAPTLLNLFSGSPGRATGGPVSPGRAYRVGENGPEIFVPTSSGRIDTNSSASGAAPINITIRVSDNGRGSAPDAIRRSSRHVARALRDALDRAGD